MVVRTIDNFDDLEGILQEREGFWAILFLYQKGPLLEGCKEMQALVETASTKDKYSQKIKFYVADLPTVPEVYHWFHEQGLNVNAGPQLIVFKDGEAVYHIVYGPHDRDITELLDICAQTSA